MPKKISAKDAEYLLRDNIDRAEDLATKKHRELRKQRNAEIQPYRNSIENLIKASIKKDSDALIETINKHLKLNIEFDRDGEVSTYVRISSMDIENYLRDIARSDADIQRLTEEIKRIHAKYDKRIDKLNQKFAQWKQKVIVHMMNGEFEKISAFKP